MKRALGLGGSAVLSLALCLWLVALPAGADPPAQQGWWTSSNAGNNVVPVTPDGADVPTNGLLVESAGSSSSPVAFAALTYNTPIPAGTTANLDLTVTSQSATTPGSTLELCPLATSSIEPAQGGPMSSAPKYDCTNHVSADVSSDGGSFHFKLDPLLTGAPLAVAILPTSNVERVVLNQPGDSSLTAPQASVPEPTTTPDNLAGSGGGAGLSPSPGLASDGTAAISVPTGSAASGQSPALAIPPAASTAIAGAPVSARPGSSARSAALPVALGATTRTRSGYAFPFPALLLVAGLAAGASLWGYAGKAAVASTRTQPLEKGWIEAVPNEKEIR